ncbi:MAG: nitrate ABC transporter [Polycyclovorans sp.]|nr:nitrate ABC transporter [Polycyclovorans sp.]MEC8848365.1 CmpA/NrtA family ABC transporter substrate-binding protein [Pseudomonadota bacterium]|tara:strand:+ start:15692 stop:16732 length:1041 start_codon:yes stop_codon:yes gene_type:complete
MHEPELSRLRMGLVPLADCAPLVVARERGFFARHGLDVSLSVEGSWAGVRDKLAAGLLDAAQMLAPMPLAAQLGMDGFGVPLISALTLSRNGNMITVSNSLRDALAGPEADPTAHGLALNALLTRERAAGKRPRVLAHVYPHSSHHFLLREWLGRSGIDADRDLHLLSIPPPLLVHCLRAGQIDGFCAGAPWGLAAEAAGVGRNLFATQKVRPDCVEKVLGVRAEWAERYPQTHLRLVAALIEAGQWLEGEGRREEAAQILARGAYLDVSPQILLAALSDRSEGNLNPGFCFSGDDLGAPRSADMAWLEHQLQDWGEVPVSPSAALNRCYRADLHQQALAYCTLER